VEDGEAVGTILGFFFPLFFLVFLAMLGGSLGGPGAWYGTRSVYSCLRMPHGVLSWQMRAVRYLRDFNLVAVWPWSIWTWDYSKV